MAKQKVQKAAKKPRIYRKQKKAAKSFATEAMERDVVHKTMPPGYKRFYVYDVETTLSVRKDIKVLHESNDFAMAWNFLWHQASINCEGRKHYQLIEREDAGVLFVRANVEQDGRPFCKRPQDMGPDKFGYIS